MSAMSAFARFRVLVVEDDERMLKILTRHLDRLGFAVEGVSRGFDALEALRHSPVDVVLSDVRMPGMDGHTLLQEVRERHPGVKVVLITAFGSVEAAVDAVKAGAHSYVCKPFKVEKIAMVLRNATREIELTREVEVLRRDARGRWTSDRLIGPSEPMRLVRRQIDEAARVTAPVLITGRSGTGKEVAARAIHCSGRRADGPFVPVNCAAIPESLFESTMFGHSRGAFTGADRAQEGLIEQSSGGSLFLDEVADIPLPQQTKLLRVLQESELRPVGGSRTIRVDLRVVSATNRSIEAMIRQGDFREDLYYRINVLRIRMPELSDRPDDIPALAEHLLGEVAHDSGVRAAGFTDEALVALKHRRWPGNVRELRNCIERVLLRTAGLRIDAGDIDAGDIDEAMGVAPAGTPAGDSSTSETPRSDPGDRSLAAIEEAHIERVLEECDWNRSGAARALGIDRRTLFSKIQRYGLVGRMRPGPKA